MTHTKDEALKLALEAHQAMREWIDAVPDDTVLPAMPGCDRDWLDTVEAILKKALAQPAPVQEPVAWMHTMIDDVVVGHQPADLNVHPDRWMPLYKDPTPCQTCEALARTVMMDQTAHDTTPPAAQRQWVGLSQNELDAMFSNTIKGKKLVNWVARAIEAKLKEKNT
jgi:hypothetical protein